MYTNTKQRLFLLKDTTLFLEAGSSINDLILHIWNAVCADTSQCCTSLTKKSNSIKSASSVNMTLPREHKPSPPGFFRRNQVPYSQLKFNTHTCGQMWIFFKVPAYILACKTTDQIGRYHLNIWVETYSFESYRQSFGISLEKETCVTSSWDFYKLLCREHGIGLSATWIGADLTVYVSLITSFSASEAIRVW